MELDMDAIKDTIEHMAHPHPLKLIPKAALHDCDCCGYLCNVGYSCILEARCSFKREPFVCILCAKLAEMEEPHPFHPHHPPLNLARVNPGFAEPPTCDSCFRSITNYVEFCYRCVECRFELHVHCAQSVNAVTISRPFHHPHPLTLMLKWSAPKSLPCDSCHCPILDYGTSICARCVPCNLNYHIYCGAIRDLELVPFYISYFQGHRQHPLTITDKYMYEPLSCDVCRKTGCNRLLPDAYVCGECDFKAHIYCVMRSLLCPSIGVITDNIVGMLSNVAPVHEAEVALCQRCKKRVRREEVPAAYGCQHCNFFIHESCVHPWLNEGVTFSHPLIHPQHINAFALVFTHGQVLPFACACCGRACGGFMFRCKECPDFVLDLECMFLVPSLKHIDHCHPVLMLHDDTKFTSKACYLRCVQCSENFNIKGCYLPRTVLHECHSHPLTLTSKLFECYGSNKSYCDACEHQRNPDECIYYCFQCEFEVHIACVKSEVLGPSCNKLKDVKFATLQEIEDEAPKEENIQGKHAFLLEEELQNYAHFSLELFNDILQIASQITWENAMGETPSPSNKIRHENLYSDEPFQKFTHIINSGNALKELSSTLDSTSRDKVVRVGEYMVPSNSSVQFLKTLFDEYGDFGAKCTCGQEAKQYLFVGLCKTLQSMRDTKISRVKESLLVEWWTWLVMGKAAGFKIEFALKILKRVVYAHFGLEADKYADGKLTVVRKIIREVPQEMKEVRRELEKLTKVLNEKERVLEEAITEEEKLREAAFRSKKSDLMTKCLTEAEDLACYTVGELLLPPSDDQV